jgi:hypothetical protein
VHPFFYVDVWYGFPFARYFLNSVAVSAIAVVGNVIFNAMAGYALTHGFRGKNVVLLLFLSCMMVPFQATIIPAYLITGRLGLLDSWLGLALPQCSTIICIFVFKASFDAIPRSLIDAARIDGLSEWRIIWHIMMPLSTSAIATNVILAFIWSWNNFLWPLIMTRSADMQTLARRGGQTGRRRDRRALDLQFHDLRGKGAREDECRRRLPVLQQSLAQDPDQRREGRRRPLAAHSGVSLLPGRGYRSRLAARSGGRKLNARALAPAASICFYGGNDREES